MPVKNKQTKGGEGGPGGGGGLFVLLNIHVQHM